MTAYEMRISDWSSDGCSSDLPVQYSCQQNFTILSTDGYWNGSEDAAVQINGSTKVGNQDATELRPMYDGTVTANVTYTPATQIGRASCRERVSVRGDLGGRRNIKKKKLQHQYMCHNQI